MEMKIKKFLDLIKEEKIKPVGLDFKINETKEEYDKVLKIDEIINWKRTYNRAITNKEFFQCFEKEIEEGRMMRIGGSSEEDDLTSSEILEKLRKADLSKEVKEYLENTHFIEDVLPVLVNKNLYLHNYHLEKKMIYEILPIKSFFIFEENEGTMNLKKNKEYDYEIDLKNKKVIFIERKYDKYYEERKEKILYKKGDFYFIEKGRNILLFKEQKELYPKYHLKQEIKEDLINGINIRIMIMYSKGNNKKKFLIKFDKNFEKIEKYEKFNIYPNRRKIKNEMKTEYYAIPIGENIIIYNKYGYNMIRKLSLKSIKSCERIEPLKYEKINNNCFIDDYSPRECNSSKEKKINPKSLKNKNYLITFKLNNKEKRNIFKENLEICEKDQNDSIKKNIYNESFVVVMNKYVVEIKKNIIEVLEDEREGQGKINLKRYLENKILKIYLGNISNQTEEYSERDSLKEFMVNKSIGLYIISLEKEKKKKIVYLINHLKKNYKKGQFLEFFKSYYNLEEVYNGRIKLKKRDTKTIRITLYEIAQFYNCFPENAGTMDIAYIEDKEFLNFMISFINDDNLEKEINDFENYLWEWKEKIKELIESFKIFSLKEWKNNILNNLKKLKYEKYNRIVERNNIIKNIEYLKIIIPSREEYEEIEEKINKYYNYCIKGKYKINQEKNLLKSIEKIIEKIIKENIKNKIDFIKEERKWQNIIERQECIDFLEILENIGKNIEILTNTIFIKNDESLELLNIVKKDYEKYLPEKSK